MAFIRKNACNPIFVVTNCVDIISGSHRVGVQKIDNSTPYTLYNNNNNK